MDQPKSKEQLPYPPPSERENPISRRERIAYVEDQFFHTGDLKQREIQVNNMEGTILYLDPLTDNKLLQSAVLDPLTSHPDQDPKEILLSVDIKQETDLTKGIEGLTNGKSLLISEGKQKFFLLGTEKVYKRDINEPANEGVVRGPHDGFTEVLNINLYSIRKRVKNSDLTIRFHEVGNMTKTKIAVVFMKSLVNPELVREVEKRIQSISADMVMTPGFLQEYTEDNSFSPFPQQLNTERPDRVVANIMEGRVAVLADGDPTALIKPVTLFAFYQSPDDYYNRWIVSSFVRLIRLVSFFIAFLLPAAYIATVAFHPVILPLELIFTIKGSLERIPFPPMVEALLIELIFELLREAGIRMPSRVGQTIGIVGGLVIGDAIVRAGLVSYTMIIVVSLTAIASFLVPSNEMSTAIRVLRFPLMLAAALFGYVGITLGVMFTFIHLCKLESFGTPYLSPIAPFRLRDWKDTFVRFPAWKLNRRSSETHPQKMRQEYLSREWEAHD
ncbi:spore germination protein [Kroppenstedtia pulmonis]|uniref:spore germination protein n=1 Tax=Kroppenstedtia pulmonis TaxID=1380685 RepID=UPI003CCD849F